MFYYCLMTFVLGYDDDFFVLFYIILFIGDRKEGLLSQYRDSTLQPVRLSISYYYKCI